MQAVECWLTGLAVCSLICNEFLEVSRLSCMIRIQHAITALSAAANLLLSVHVAPSVQ